MKDNIWSTARDVLVDYGEQVCDNLNDCDCSMGRLARLVRESATPPEQPKAQHDCRGLTCPQHGEENRRRQASPPKHRHEMRLTLGANSLDDLTDRLRRIADDLDREQRDEARDVASSAGFHFTIAHDPTMTEERFKRELMAWWEANKAERRRGATETAPGATGAPSRVSPDVREGEGL